MLQQSRIRRRCGGGLRLVQCRRHGGLTLGGGYGALIGRVKLALDNLLAAEVVLADGRVAVADRDNEPELFWAVRGGGGNFGVVTSMRHRLHEMPSVRSGVLVYPFSEVEVVLERCAGIAASAREELTFQEALAGRARWHSSGHDRTDVVRLAIRERSTLGAAVAARNAARQWRDHVMVGIRAAFPDEREEQGHRQWARSTFEALGIL
jgi:FAD/FMN-containing dehydrogenase